jgi:KUP system potassium uptake protein
MQSDTLDNKDEVSGRFLRLTLGALGVVFGDIGTSPLYSLRECFHGENAINYTSANLLGILSLIIWSLIVIVGLKYVLVVMRADNHGEGGVLALMAFTLRSLVNTSGRKAQVLVYLGLCGAALMYGDGIITPAISVLSAVEGLKIALPLFSDYVLLITVLVLTVLFSVQKHGTERLGKWFGPIILLWFSTLAILGTIKIVEHPLVLLALSPQFGIDFFLTNGWAAFFTLGAIFLSVTGAEALYADMGHFGRNPIRVGWFYLVLPALVLNYLGQGALILGDPSAIDNPFYLLSPNWARIPLVFLATATTVIASQAVISGAYSLTHQAVQLGYLPRLRINHTSSEERGQIYIPFVNWMLFIGTVALVLLFQTSSNLAAAYGIAVSATMVITNAIVFFVAKDTWKWPPFILLPIFLAFTLIDLSFFAANLSKFMQGGWLPTLIGGVIFTLMTTWWRGRKIMWNQLKSRLIPFQEWRKRLDVSKFSRVSGTAVFMISDLEAVPSALIANLRCNHVLHERVIFVTLVTESRPYMDREMKRVIFSDLGDGFFRVIGKHGFMEPVDVSEILTKACNILSKEELLETFFFIDRPIPIPTAIPGMAMWREAVFAFLMQNSLRPTKFYKIPTEQVIEIGYQVEI